MVIFRGAHALLRFNIIKEPLSTWTLYIQNKMKSMDKKRLSQYLSPDRDTVFIWIDLTDKWQVNWLDYSDRGFLYRNQGTMIQVDVYKFHVLYVTEYCPFIYRECVIYETCTRLLWHSVCFMGLIVELTVRK